MKYIVEMYNDSKNEWVSAKRVIDSSGKRFFIDRIFTNKEDAMKFLNVQYRLFPGKKRRINDISP